MKHIDADRLTAFVKARRDLHYKYFVKNGVGCIAEYKYDEDVELLDFIDSLQQEQPNDVRAEIQEYYGEDLAFDDERTKSAYHFFSAGKAFELREYEKERRKHITDLLDNFQKGMKAGYEKAISELKDGKIECGPVMKAFIEKIIKIGKVNNFGFGSKNFQQEQPEVDLEEELDTYYDSPL